jgi:HEAT repeat protein
MSGVRDYLTEADGMLGCPKPLRQMYAEDAEYTMRKLVDFFESGDLQRKAAIYALGQLGDEAALPMLREQIGRESKPGLRDAARAAIAALEHASLQKGSSEMDRRQVIDNVYNGRAPFQNTQPEQPAEPSKAGGCLVLIVALGLPIGSLAVLALRA